MTCMKQDFCIHEKYCQRHIGQNFDSCILFSRNSKPMTNEEWLKQCTTEQLAEVLWEQINGAFNSGYACCNLKQDKDYVGRYKRFIEWLKRPHNEKE